MPNTYLVELQRQMRIAHDNMVFNNNLNFRADAIYWQKLKAELYANFNSRRL